MIFRAPILDEDEHHALAQVARLQTDLALVVRAPRRWLGTLRRLTLARAVQGSNSIEGYHASLDDVVAAVEGDETLDADSETQMALAGYRDAMTYVLQLSQDDDVKIDESLIRSLHFMMMRHHLNKNPGRWRPGPIWVRQEPEGEIVYEGPPAAMVPDLLGELIDSLSTGDQSVIVRAAMAHLNLAMIHPFSDGNGRMARCLQTLVLAREKIVAPVFSSIEEYLGANTEPYYSVLATTARHVPCFGGSKKPRDCGMPARCLRSVTESYNAVSGPWATRHGASASATLRTARSSRPPKARR